MASTTTMNEWSEQLARSLLPGQVPSSRIRKHVDHFKRSLKHHNYVTTNQFEIEERLNGLEEKFQVLNQAELSDALHQRRSELLQHQHRWVSDALDLLLKLSHHPLQHARIEQLDVRNEQTAVPTSLKWSDIDAEDPVDRRSRLWRLPDYTDFSSEDEEVLPSSTDTSPEKVTKPLERTQLVSTSAIRAIQSVPDPVMVSRFKDDIFWISEDEVTITEPQVGREILFMIQGYPTSLFTGRNGQMVPNPKFKLKNLSAGSMNSELLSVIEIAKAAHSLNEWSAPHQKLPFMQVLEDEIQRILKSFYDTVSELETQHLRITKEGGVISLLKLIDQLQRASPAVETAQAFLRDVKGQDAISHLDVLCEHVCRLQHLADLESYQALLKVFLLTLKSYTRGVDHWIDRGMIAEPSGCFFVQRVADQGDKACLWQSWYSFNESGPNRPPKLFRPLTKHVFACGKTIAFAKLLGHIPVWSGDSQTLSSIVETAISPSSSLLQPLAATLSDSIAQRISTGLHSATTLLQTTLQQKCDLISTLNAFSALYLSGSPLATYIIDSRLFSHLDRCDSTWNDRLPISDLLSEVHVNSRLDINRVTVHSEPTPVSTLAAARRSVDVFANIAFDYLLPWPIANIILPEALASYRRVSLLLMQIRRAKYVLERRAYLRLRMFSASQTHSGRSRKATGLSVTLLNFATTLYAHLTSCIISPFTRQLHYAISSSSWTVDDLIFLHTTYLRSLEFSCLATKNLKVLKDTVVGLLDICVDFGFTLSEISGTQNTDKDDGRDVEAKIQKMGTQFRRQVDFLIAGLRGVARSNVATTAGSGAGSVEERGAPINSDLKGHWQAPGEMMELLADSLESALFRKRQRPK